MRELIPTPRFERALRKYTKRNVELRERVQKTLEQMREDVFATNLGTHKLSGNLEGINACSCGYECRVLFMIEKELESESEMIVLLDVGNHDDVY
jgi:mRNA interferase YafQ